jgi:Putative addiction module component
MSTTLEALEAEVLRLSAADRSRLLDRLIASLDADKELDKAWDREAARRDAEIEDGTSIAVPGKEAVERLRAQIR